MNDISQYVNRILSGDSLFELRKLPAKSIHCCVTSPPYYALRSYAGIAPTSWPAMKYSIFGFEIEVPAMVCELGHEPDAKQFIGHIILIFREVWRVLRDDGTIWVNMGDSYVTSGKDRTEAQANANSTLKGGLETESQVLKQQSKITDGLKPKDMIGIPWMMAFALRDDGWYLRSDIIWAKKNTMPESVTDRPTKSHEYIFLLSKSQKYYYDAEAIKTPAAESSKQRWDQDVLSQTGSARVPGKTNGNMKAVGGPMKNLPDGQTNIRKARDKQRGHHRRHAGFNDRWDSMTTVEQSSMGANKRTVWHIATNSFKDAHFATFPEELITDPIKAGCPIDGIVLDPFSGSGTTAIVASKLGRKFIGIEISKDYVPMSEKRINEELGMFSPLI